MDAPYHRDRLREALIEEGRTMLIHDGYAHFSLRKLAKQLEVSHTAPYRHFKSREDLLMAIVTLDGERFNRALAEGVRGIEDPRERLFCLGEAYVNFYIDNPETLVLFTVLPDLLAGQGERILNMVYPEPCAVRTGELPEYGGDEGFLLLKEAAAPLGNLHPGLNAREIILGYWAKVHGLACLLVSQKGFLSDEELRSSIGRIIRSPF